MISRIGGISQALFRFRRKNMFCRDLGKPQFPGRGAVVVRALARKLQRMQGV